MIYLALEKNGFPSSSNRLMMGCFMAASCSAVNFKNDTFPLKVVPASGFASLITRCKWSCICINTHALRSSWLSMYIIGHKYCMFHKKLKWWPWPWSLKESLCDTWLQLSSSPHHLLIIIISSPPSPLVSSGPLWWWPGLWRPAPLPSQRSGSWATCTRTWGCGNRTEHQVPEPGAEGREHKVPEPGT